MNNKNNYKQNSAPLAEAMQKYSASGALAFHTPGHKQGLGAHDLLKNLVTAEGLRQEVSLMEELDDLHSPHSCLQAAEILAAETFCADEVLFFVNGTTSAIQAMILATLEPGDLVFVPRNSHRAVISGLILSGAVPIFLPIDFDSELKIPLNLKVETLQDAIKKFPQAKALILTSPNYYGVAADVKKIAELLHEKKMLLLVDEAHGAHLQFGGEIFSAMASGADFSAQSTHKVLGSLTQTSMLLCRKKFATAARRASSLLQTTSPNQLLLASLDIARLQMAQVGAEKISNAHELAKKLRAEIFAIDKIRTFSAVKNFQLDLLKVTVNVEQLGITGLEAEKILRRELKIQCELSDAANLLFLITYADNSEKISALVEGLRQLKRLQDGKMESKLAEPITHYALRITHCAVSPREIFFAETAAVELEKAVGKICAEEVTFYPPGIPILSPGEIVRAEVVSYIREQKKLGGRIIGAADAELSTIKILTCKI